MSEVTPENKIQEVAERYARILEENYVGGDLARPASFEFWLDGLPERLSVPGNYYAAWCANLHGALNLDWGWGFFEVVDTIQSRGGYFVEHNELNYLGETFTYLNWTFGTTTPDVPEHTQESTLHQLLTQELLSEVWCGVTLPEGSYQFSKEEFITEYSDKAAPYIDKLIALIEGK
ncbi:hypothetical protein [Marinobacter salsuginis]|uniref:Uncharacterized protein n=1 Tax=Marinobacter salsuginis TaxID=418719 RepID=A0A5M3Q217_9GAMM|nr:hypothetical protein [Marinobacter salsuginis]GBO89162.1 hypothetical protein MSSD14B_28300 [Marinobacter salsuginis]